MVHKIRMHLKVDFVFDLMEYSKNSGYLWWGETGEKNEKSFHVYAC